mmetsp:Transcript_58799/g.70126  ORF Transcript_58799/g.70126 Transcript_58799/m.70126 type:complete len:136 (-) Transcript_58799:124-531(-)|eukprot:CAMPEP_0172484206 /NCGR_PEP_ID=MMETSP1066-20121228/11573_1 /TAXON_ID=671091 /ORGANISM="Coscinodiscus wailesii, Strain CCMP2513" /LENGTH=135 /DNA_ID=CAMNT_0013248553 /DNA_START=114 /DNA_END=521 /DNA_ORIENTATION=+
MSRPSSYSCNDNQNYFVEAGRTTSRVLQQPGGKTSINLGWDSNEKSNGGGNRRQTGSNGEVTGKTSEPAGANSAIGCRTTGNAKSRNLDCSGPERNVSGNAFANGNNQNCGNVITDRPSSRVLAPPGGKTSIQLG